MNQISDEELMTAVSNGELDKMGILFERHHLYVYNFLLKMSGDRAASEDITQEVFYKILKYRHTYNQGRFTSWMFSITRNHLSTYFSKNKKTVALNNIKHLVADDFQEDYEDELQLKKALDKLKPSEKELIILNRYQNIKYNEIAEIIGSTLSAVRTKVCRALKKLRTIYCETI